MIKRNLLGGALLVVVLVLLSGCKEIMSNLNNPVSAYLQLSEASTKIYRGQTYQIKYSTISDAKPIFKSADEKIATVDANGVVTGANRGTTKITIEVPATENYNGASIEFVVEVDALLNLPKDAKELALNEEYNLGVTSVSKGKITYKSSNTKVATVDADGNVTAKGYGDATITVSIAATPEYDRTESVDFAAKVCVFNETELNAIINTAAAGDGKVKVMLKDGFELENDLNLEGKKIELDLMNSILTFKGNHSIIINDNFTLKNAKIDASGTSSNAVFLMSSNPLESSKNSKNCYEVEEVNFDGVTVTGIQKRFFYDNKKAYVVKNFKVNNCVIGLATVATESDIEGAIEFNAGGILEFDIENSTVYQTSNLNVKYFTKYNNSKVPDNAIADYTACNFWTYKNNTFYKVAKEQWHNGGRIAQKASTMTIDIENNIWVDCATNGGGILRRMFGGNKKSTDFKKATISLNTYWLNGAAEDNSGYDKTESPTPLTTDPDFVNAPTNFKPQGDDQVAKKTGDPRWLK